jgi:hypothetical protein
MPVVTLMLISLSREPTAPELKMLPASPARNDPAPNEPIAPLAKELTKALKAEASSIPCVPNNDPSAALADPAANEPMFPLANAI